MKAKLLRLLLLTSVSFLFVFQVKGQNLDKNKKYYTVCAGFYNLENLFDTIANEVSNSDLSFTPSGDKKYNSEKYYAKINNLGEVINKLGTEFTPDGLAFIGVSEVENKSVLVDLVNSKNLKKHNYQIVHYESPDHRGIDVGFLYNPKYFKVLSSKTFTLVMEDTSFHTRNQLLVTGELLGEKIYVIVAHWPSRYGGEKRSAPNRNAAADLGRSVMDSILLAEPDAKILYMGDLNDDPVNNSVKKHIVTVSKQENVTESTFFNPMEALYKKGIGTLAWHDSWNLFDQIILSQGVTNKDFKSWTYFAARVFNKPFLTQSEGQYKGYPYRSFVGDTWEGGYSDHFPVYVVLVKELIK